MRNKRVLLVGSGGRECALARSLLKDSEVELYSARSGPNPGIEDVASKTLSTETDIDQIVAFAKGNSVDYCVVGPEKPLELGVTDALKKAGIPSASPSRAAAAIETNKVFMRELMTKFQVPGRLKHFHALTLRDACAVAESLEWRVAVKPIGLTGGKGVKVFGSDFDSAAGAQQAIRTQIDQHSGGSEEVLIEELAVGEEFTLHFFCDGKNAVPTPLIQDHKRAFDGDKGPNTGGMGSYSIESGLLPFLNQQHYADAVEIGRSVVRALEAEGTPFIGPLYGQFIIGGRGVQVIEFNARFGDPEAINTLGLLEQPYSIFAEAMIGGHLPSVAPSFSKRSSVVAYVAPKGYGTSPQAGSTVEVDQVHVKESGCDVFFASCEKLQGSDQITRIRTLAGRSFALASFAKDLDQAHASVREALKGVKGNFAHRTDIGSREAVARRVSRALSCGVKV